MALREGREGVGGDGGGGHNILYNQIFKEAFFYGGVGRSIVTWAVAQCQDALQSSALHIKKDFTFIKPLTVAPRRLFLAALPRIAIA